MSTPKNTTWKTLFFGAVCLAALFFVLYTATFLNSQNKSEKIVQLQSTIDKLRSQKVSSTQLSQEMEDTSDLLDGLTIDFDREIFELQKSQGHLNLNLNTPGGGDNQYVPALSLRLKSTDNPIEVLSIVDVSQFANNSTNIKDILSSLYGAAVESELREVFVGDRTYSFEADYFAEGMPINDDGSCWGESALKTHYFLLDNRIAVVVPTSSNETSCVGEAPEIVNTPDPETIEKVLKVIESISY